MDMPPMAPAESPLALLEHDCDCSPQLNFSEEMQLDRQLELTSHSPFKPFGRVPVSRFELKSVNLTQTVTPRNKQTRTEPTNVVV
jgi:hypothetical protein